MKMFILGNIENTVLARNKSLEFTVKTNEVKKAQSGQFEDQEVIHVCRVKQKSELYNMVDQYCERMKGMRVLVEGKIITLKTTKYVDVKGITFLGKRMEEIL
jgi:single-stranded DNA-binding protein